MNTVDQQRTVNSEEDLVFLEGLSPSILLMSVQPSSAGQEEWPSANTLASRTAFSRLLYRAGHSSVTWTVWKARLSMGVRTSTGRSSVAAMILPSVHLMQGIPLLFHFEVNRLSFSPPQRHTAILPPITSTDREQSIERRDTHLLPPFECAGQPHG